MLTLKVRGLDGNVLKARAHARMSTSMAVLAIITLAVSAILVLSTRSNAVAMDEGAQLASVIEARAATIDLSQEPMYVDSTETQSFSTVAYEDLGNGVWFSSALSMNVGSQVSMLVGGGITSAHRWGDWTYTETYFSEVQDVDTSRNIELHGKVIDVYTDTWGDTVFVTDSPFIEEVAVLPLDIIGSGGNKHVWRTDYSLSRGNARQRNRNAMTDFPHAAWGEPYENFFVSGDKTVTAYFFTTSPPEKGVFANANARVKATRTSLRAEGD